MMNGYEWEWFLTLNLPEYQSREPESYLKEWRCNLCKLNHIQVCYMGIVINSRITGNHIHLLMFGRNKDGKTLVDMNPKEWENEWGRITHRGSHIDLVRDDGVIDYITSSKNTPINHFEMVCPYNGYLMKKYRKLN